MVDGPKKQDKTEKELIRRSVEGESSAFGLLYDKYQPHIFRFVYLKVGQREEAEDLTHQVFLSAWENIETFRDQGLPISSWLYKIARNRIIDHYRTRKTAVSIEQAPEEIMELAAITDDHANTLDTKFALEKVYKALAQLSQDQQDIIIMRFVQDLSYKEIADVIGKNQGAVRVIQHRAIKILKDLLQEL